MILNAYKLINYYNILPILLMNSLTRLFSSYISNSTKVVETTLSNKTLYLKKDSQYLAKEAKYGAHNYKPLPVVLNRGFGVHL